jgi:SAM-dependent methyltransferase
MGDYSQAAEFYDLLYGGMKDYEAEADLLVSLIREATPQATTVLDVGCGTGAHARLLTDRGLLVDGLDIEPAFVDIAREKCPEGEFRTGDMRAFDLPERYDAVVCLFSAIGYVLDEEGLHAAVACMARHLSPSGVLIVDPWFEPGKLTEGWVTTLSGESEDTSVVRMSRNVIEGRVSTLEFEYLVGTSAGIERRSEVHELGLFTQDQMEAAFRAAGLSVERKPEMLRTRGIYVGTPA